jgi:hypothetical protein
MLGIGRVAAQIGLASSRSIAIEGYLLGCAAGRRRFQGVSPDHDGATPRPPWSMAPTLTGEEPVGVTALVFASRIGLQDALGFKDLA